MRYISFSLKIYGIYLQGNKYPQNKEEHSLPLSFFFLLLFIVILSLAREFTSNSLRFFRVARPKMLKKYFYRAALALASPLCRGSGDVDDADVLVLRRAISARSRTHFFGRWKPREIQAREIPLAVAIPHARATPGLFAPCNEWGRSRSCKAQSGRPIFRALRDQSPVIRID